jgi:hypothetical protein
MHFTVVEDLQNSQFGDAINSAAITIIEQVFVNIYTHYLLVI